MKTMGSFPSAKPMMFAAKKTQAKISFGQKDESKPAISGQEPETSRVSNMEEVVPSSKLAKWLLPGGFLLFMTGMLGYHQATSKTAAEVPPGCFKTALLRTVPHEGGNNQAESNHGSIPHTHVLNEGLEVDANNPNNAPLKNAPTFADTLIATCGDQLSPETRAKIKANVME
ncbi:MAG TPA: hypothetical protein V6C52_05590 [Coleofasciculaceae cyanobacterium]|jgi:hypothetical protein